ncbi:hypothetical protein P5673_000023 [Acropora cervicornis]|uniref:Uncharacterized protein n=1 Tax=Acropora cervicornis TaxID=6130 RepID=A0AAD9VGT0_ACRCE|nr:hypothetical protein P5673_000023 [Acropora cervicornis]
MLGHTLVELFGNIVFNFTRSVAERCDIDDRDDVANTIGYYPLEDTGKEWYAQHTGELIYQEYSNSKATSADYLTSSGSLRAQLIDASSTSATTHTPELSPEARDMAWKSLRPSISRTVLNSLSYGFLISVLSATVCAVDPLWKWLDVAMDVAIIESGEDEFVFFSPLDSVTTNLKTEMHYINDGSHPLLLDRTCI